MITDTVHMDVKKDTGDRPAVTIAHKIVTIRPVPGMMGAVLAVNRIGKENSVAVSF